MAGIAGIFGSSVQREDALRMLEKIKHRGPNTLSTCYKNGLCAGVVASKLSESRGNGLAREADIAVLFDGEIYNKRSEGQSDAAVVLKFYKKYGRIFPGYLEGVFACAVYDGRELLLARDSIGVRPLYFGKTRGGSVCFASEMKALAGIAKEVAELHPSTTFSTSNGISKFLPLFGDVYLPSSAKEAADKLRQHIVEAVERRLADNAIGACLLSGGLDSSIIASVAHKIQPNLLMVTVGTEGAPDMKNAELMTEYLGAKHHVYIYGTEQIKQIIRQAIYALESFDEDCVSGAIANLFASARAANHTNCILSGEGGDELFGGYHLLKGLPTEFERLKMMDRLIAIAYNTAVQRLDRAMMANSINYRTPFLDTKVIAYAMQLPVQWKVHDNGNGRLIEKWILREAFKDMLPEEICSRQKLRFSGGTGTDDLMDAIMAEEVDAGGFKQETCTTECGYRLNSLKELWYYKLFKEKFPSPDFEKLVGRWDPYK